MADRLLVELGAAGQISVGQWLEGDLLPSTGAASELLWPLDEDALEDLRWYLEDYLRAPFGVYGERGPKVQARLSEWGEAVFSAVFGSGAARDAYVRMRARSGGVEVVFRSASPALLGLPWELMRDPGRPTPLALDVLGVSRSLPVAESAETIPVPGGRLRVLMVISRPGGTADVGYQMIARPLLQRLEAVRGQVDLVVLRPPTLAALGQALAGAAEGGEPFQVVHFDGHGALSGRRPAGAGAPFTFQGPAPEGVLVFERSGGGPDYVPASRVAQVLKAAQVPVVVLNACQSGAVGKQLEAAVATRLLQEGIASVVAMAYTVYAVAAAEFMAAFYERLFAGDTVSVAVTAGRQRLFQHDRRPSPKGSMPLADWVVPVHYLRRDINFPQARTPRPSGKPTLDAALDQLREPAQAQGTVGGALDPVGSFVGRDALFFELEAAARLQKVVVLHGPGGTGKTELAKAFGRWWRDTGGVEDPQWVFWHSFEPGVASFGLDGVITQIGLAVFGPDFAALDPGDRRAVVRNLLDQHRLLMIWDNFETVQSMPDPAQATPQLDQAGLQELKVFLEHLAQQGRSSVIITSRTSEDWLGDIRHLTVGGLAPHEAAEYAGELLAPYADAQPRRAGRAFGELMEWLGGHPLSMRLILPHLDTTEPEVMLEGLQGIAPLPGGQHATGTRTTSLAASITYSYAHLAVPTRRLLAAVSLFQGVADVDVLATFSQAPGVPERFQGASREEWGTALEEGVKVGLLTALGAGMYQIHPALPAYLTAQWRTEEHDGSSVRGAAILSFIIAYAHFGDWLLRQIHSGEAALAYAIIGLQQRTLGYLLGYALDGKIWSDAQSIAQPLNLYWEAQGRFTEADAWTDRVRLAVEGSSGEVPALDSDAGSLWLFFTGAQATRQIYSGQLGDSERTYSEILAMLEAQPDSPFRQDRLAVTYHLIGSVALQRRQLDEAADWYSRSAAINEELGNHSRLAMCQHQLGRVAQERGRLDEAENWYTKSLALEDDLGDRPGLAASYHQLGNLALARGRLDEAEDWYTKSLAIKESLGDRPGMATSYHQLGIIAFTRRRLDEAEDWYTKSMAIKESLGDRPGMATSYHQLGIIAFTRGRLDEAEEWYTKSLSISAELGDPSHMGKTLAELGLLAEERKQSRRALEWAVRSVSLFERIPDPASGTAPEQLARLTAELGVPTLEACWQVTTGRALPQAVRDFVVSSMHPGDG